MRCAALALLLLTAGCDGLDGVDPEAGDVVSSDAELTAAWVAWDAAEPDGYRLRYALVCECFGGATVTVRDGRVVAAEGPGAASPLTVDGVFALARQVFAEGAAGEVRLARDGPPYPVFVDLDRSPETVDDEIRVVVTGFEVD